MNNFCDLLAIDTKIQVKIKLGVIHDNGFPTVSIRVNNNNISHQSLANPVEHEFEVPLLEPIEIEIAMMGKKYSQHQETAVLLQSVNIDGFEIIPRQTHLARYQSDQGPQGPTSYLGFNGCWQLTIDRPFYRWRHAVTAQGWLLEPV